MQSRIKANTVNLFRFLTLNSDDSSRHPNKSFFKKMLGLYEEILKGYLNDHSNIEPRVLASKKRIFLDQINILKTQALAKSMLDEDSLTEIKQDIQNDLKCLLDSIEDRNIFFAELDLSNSREENDNQFLAADHNRKISERMIIKAQKEPLINNTFDLLTNAVKSLETIDIKYKNDEDQIKLAKLKKEIGSIHASFFKDFASAISNYEESLTLLNTLPESSDIDELKINLFKKLAEAHYQNKNFVKSIDIYKKLLQVLNWQISHAVDKNNATWIDHLKEENEIILCQLIQVYKHFAKKNIEDRSYAEAISNLKLSMHTLELITCDEFSEDFLNKMLFKLDLVRGLVICYEDTEQFQNAIIILEQMLQSLEEINGLKNEALQTLIDLANVYLHSGENKLDKDQYDQAYADFTEGLNCLNSLFIPIELKLNSKFYETGADLLYKEAVVLIKKCLSLTDPFIAKSNFEKAKQKCDEVTNHLDKLLTEKNIQLMDIRNKINADLDFIKWRLEYFSKKCEVQTKRCEVQNSEKTTTRSISVEATASVPENGFAKTQINFFTLKRPHQDNSEEPSSKKNKTDKSEDFNPQPR